MKRVIGPLLFSFLVFLISIELSTQAYNGSARPNNINVENSPQLAIYNFTVLNRRSGERYMLPNGNYYLSRGTGPITVFYTPATKLATVHQHGGPPVTVGPTTLREEHLGGSFQRPAIFLRVRAPQGNEQIIHPQSPRSPLPRSPHPRTPGLPPLVRPPQPRPPQSQSPHPMLPPYN